MDEVARRVSALSPDQRSALLGKLREKKTAAPAKAPTLFRRGDKSRGELSFAQERLWFLDQFGTNKALYNIPLAFRLRGGLQVEVLRKSLTEIIQRHEVLRTRIVSAEGRPVPAIDEAPSLPLPVTDLSGLPHEKREAESLRLCGVEAARGFDLGNELMLRAHVFRLSERDQILFLNFHHIASDGWSLGVFFHELNILYGAFIGGKPSPLPPLAIQYRDYAVWQREQLQISALADQMTYWKNHLKDHLTPLELPADRPRGTEPSYRGALISLDLSASLSNKLAELSRKEGATLFMTLLSAFQVQLRRYTNHETILVGSPIAGRNQKDLEPLLGLFVNTLVLRGDLSGNPSFRALLARTRETALDAFAHPDLPFERLIEELKPERDLTHTLLFQVLFVLQNAPREAIQLAGLEMAPVPVNSGTSKFDITLFVKDQNGSLTATIEYDSDLFDEMTIRRMLAHYQTLLGGIVANPDQRISDLPLLTEKEQRQVLLEWNQTGLEYAKERCLHELIEEQAERTPEAIAVVFGKQNLTYRELNHRASRVARYLRNAGVGPECLVGICAERSLEMVVGLLGILKAGGAYVPLDPIYPTARLDFIVRDARLKFILTQRRRRNLVSGNETTHFLIEDILSGEDQEPPGKTSGPPSPAGSSNLAYVLYTSGSTGQPKGVAIESRSAVALVAWAKATYTPDEMAGVLASTSICFDLSVFEIFVPLALGGKVILAQDALALPSLAAASEVRLINTVPSAMRELLTIGAVPHSVRVVNLAGEPLPAELVNQLYAETSVQKVYDLYGPTETTTYSTFALRKPGERPTIGRPLANEQIYLLDPNLQPVPVGIPGELHIGGAGLAREYFHRPELTTEKFIANPFRPAASDRLYRTGDLARYRPDGNIEYLGRLDHQVKIRGFRIELGEIELVLTGLPGVGESAVVVNEDARAEKRLVAYVDAGKTGSLDDQELRKALQKKLPDYMIPATFIQLDGLPHTLNGKIDRRALPAPNLAMGGAGHVLPATPCEVMLAKIWSQILGLEQVGIYDDFFEVGGHSLLAVRLQFQVEKEFGKKLPLAAFFQSPTLVEQAKLITADSPPVYGVSLSSPSSFAHDRPLFYLHFLTQAQRLAKHLGTKWSVYGVSAPYVGELRLWHERATVQITIEELASRCLAIIRNVQPSGPYRLGGGCFGGVLAFEIACQLQQLGEHVSLLALLDAFYIPGCKRLQFPGVRRWTYHGRKVLSHGINYATTKWRQRLELARKRQSDMELVSGAAQPGGDDLEGLRLPQAQFMAQLLKPYRARRYSGNVTLIRASKEPSFGFDPGMANGWETVVQGQVQVEDLNCNHMDVTEEPHIAQAAQLLEKHLLAPSEIQRASRRTDAPGDAVPAN